MLMLKTSASKEKSMQGEPEPSKDAAKHNVDIGIISLTQHGRGIRRGRINIDLILFQVVTHIKYIVKMRTNKTAWIRGNQLIAVKLAILDQYPPQQSFETITSVCKVFALCPTCRVRSRSRPMAAMAISTCSMIRSDSRSGFTCSHSAMSFSRQQETRSERRRSDPHLTVLLVGPRGCRCC